MTATVKFVEKNKRLEMTKNRSLKFEVKEEDFRTYNVSSMEKDAMNKIKHHVYSDSTLILKSIKVGRTEFQL